MTREPRYCGKDRSEDALGRCWVVLGNVFACLLEAIERKPLP